MKAVRAFGLENQAVLGVEKAELTRFEKLLSVRQAELVALRSASIEARAPVALDQQSVGRVSRVDALQQQAMAKAQEQHRATELVRIEQALRRIDEGEFGFCADCGEDIAVKRLEVDPSARLCISCAGR